MSENRETEFPIGAKVILPPTNNRGTVVAWRYEDFGTRSHPRQEQVVDVRFGDGSFTTMRAAHFLPAPLTRRTEQGWPQADLARLRHTGTGRSVGWRYQDGYRYVAAEEESDD